MRDFKTYTSQKLIQELQSGNDSRKEWMAALFRHAAAPINRVKGFKVWQDGNHPILLDSNQKFNDRLNYLHNNPVEANMVDYPEHYKYSSARDYRGETGLIAVELLD